MSRVLKGYYKARLDNAVRIANRANELLKEGYLIFDKDGSRIEKFVVEDDGEDIKVCYMYPERPNCRIVVMLGNPDYDDGLHTPVAEYNKYFDSWKIINPSDCKPFTEVIQ